MAQRVIRTKKAVDRDILGLCGAGWKRDKAGAIRDIESGDETYYVQWQDMRTTVHVARDAIRGKYLRTDRDATQRNNLLDLPDC